MLLKRYKCINKIYNLKRNEILKLKGFGEETVNNILDKEIKILAKKHIEYMKKNGIDIISIMDKEYPNILKEIYDPPISIYVKGNKEILNNKAIGIIGCRDASDYGKKASKYFAYNLSCKGYNIVSGLAKGIDSYSHIGNIQAIKEKSKESLEIGKTIAVIGSGLDNIYPKDNILLAEEIIKSGGIIISEYPIGTKPFKSNFPARNRIISGLSNSIIVVEAKEKSGTLITVDFALEQGREVFVVPGNINEINSVGTNNLIKQGAIVITKVGDILGI